MGFIVKYSLLFVFKGTVSDLHFVKIHLKKSDLSAGIYYWSLDPLLFGPLDCGIPCLEISGKQVQCLLLNLFLKFTFVVWLSLIDAGCFAFVKILEF